MLQDINSPGSRTSALQPLSIPRLSFLNISYIIAWHNWRRLVPCIIYIRMHVLMAICTNMCTDVYVCVYIYLYECAHKCAYLWSFVHLSLSVLTRRSCVNIGRTLILYNPACAFVLSLSSASLSLLFHAFVVHVRVLSMYLIICVLCQKWLSKHALICSNG